MIEITDEYARGEPLRVGAQRHLTVVQVGNTLTIQDDGDNQTGSGIIEGDVFKMGFDNFIRFDGVLREDSISGSFVEDWWGEGEEDYWWSWGTFTGTR